MMIFEVQTQRTGQNWITQSNWDNSADALREANNLVGSRRFRGVKVIKSRLDPNNMFRETTIFRHQLDERRRHARAKPVPATHGYVPEPVRQTLRIERRGGTLAWIICLGIATHAALALFMYKHRGPESVAVRPNPEKAVVYELPAMGSDAGTAGRDGVKATLHLEADDRAAIERALPAIVDNLSREIERHGAGALRRR